MEIGGEKDQGLSKGSLGEPRISCFLGFCGEWSRKEGGRGFTEKPRRTRIGGGGVCISRRLIHDGGLVSLVDICWRWPHRLGLPGGGEGPEGQL